MPGLETQLELFDQHREHDPSPELSAHAPEAMFGRVVTAMVTPFYGRGLVNYDAAQELAVWLQDHGSEGLVVAGTTGESPTISHDEHITLIKAVHEAVDIPVLAGTGSNNTMEAESLSRRVTKNEAAEGLLVVSPYYNRPDDDGIEQYYRDVAAVTDLPIVIYDIEARTGRAVAEDTIERLVNEVPNIVGLKDASKDMPVKAVSLAGKLAGSEFQLYSGNDNMNLELARSANAVGAISVASHWAGPELARMYDALAWGMDDLAGRINDILDESYTFEAHTRPNPQPAKAMMRYLGLAVGIARKPLFSTSESEQQLEEEAAGVYQRLKQAADEL